VFEFHVPEQELHGPQVRPASTTCEAYEWRSRLDAGARTDIRDEFLKSTPLGWACRWSRVTLVELLLARGADPSEADAESWATPPARAERRHHVGIASILRLHGAGR
jgi:hypothetical protein